MNNEKYLISVYGSLRKGLHNHYLLRDSKFLGSFKSEPLFTMYNLGSFPALSLNGNTSIFFEIYEVDENVRQEIYHLEGYSGKRGSEYNAYDTIDIETPFGKAEVFIMKRKLNAPIVKSGNWKYTYGI